ncbi:hypothetical protein [Streptomyces sp. NPDC046805]
MQTAVGRWGRTVPTSLLMLPNTDVGVVTGNGPQTVDIQALDIRGKVGRR